MLIQAGEALTLGAADGSWLRFGEEPKAEGTWAGRRLLFVRDRPAFELSFWCGTCQFLFRRLEGANETGSLDDLADRLADGVQGIDREVVDAFASLLPADTYFPMLLGVQPRLVLPSVPGDYFAEEQVETWGLDSFWGLPEYPRTPYYRTFETVVDGDAHLFEFIVPMVPPSWNDAKRVERFGEILAGSGAPTAVAVSTLDVCQPANANAGDYFQHWSLTHFLLDGHHKVEAAARSGKPLRLLSLLATDASLATPDRVAAVPRLRAQQPAPRSSR